MRVPSRHVLALALICLATDTVAQEDVADESCPADGGGSDVCRQAHAARVTASRQNEKTVEPATSDGLSDSKLRVASAHKEVPVADLITQQVEELKGVVALGRKRIALLKELNDVVSSGHNLGLPEAHMKLLMGEQIPLMSGIEVNPDRKPISSSDEFYIAKAVIPQDSPVRLIKFLPMRNPRTTSSSPTSATQTHMPSALLVAVQADGIARIFTPNGELVSSFSTGHNNDVEHLAVSPSHDEYLILTADTLGYIRVHLITVRQMRSHKARRGSTSTTTQLVGEDRPSQYLGLHSNVTSQLNKQMALPEREDGLPNPNLTSLAMVSHRNTKYIVAGDVEGKVHVFSKNGSFRFSIDTTLNATEPTGAVEFLQASPNMLLYKSGMQWGLIDIDKAHAKPLSCPKFDGKVRSAHIDSQKSSRIYVADEAGTVWVFQVKGGDECTVDFRFERGATNGNIDFQSVNGYLLGVEHTESASSLLALNMSHVGRRKHELGQYPSPVVWRRSRGPISTWTVCKRYQHGDLVAFLSKDGHEIEVGELLMQVYKAPSTEDAFGNFKLPVIAVAVVLVLGYQYMKQKGGRGGGGGRGGMDFGKHKGGGLGGLGGGGLGGRGGLGGGKFGGGGIGGGLGARGGLGSKGLGSLGSKGLGSRKKF